MRTCNRTLPMTIVDVLPTMVEQEAYARSVSQWARSVLDTLNGQDPAPYS